MLLLCDLDDTLVERATVLEQWLADFGERHQLDAGELDRVRELDDQGRRDRVDFFTELRRRHAIPTPVEELVEGWLQDFAARYRLPPDVRQALATARSLGWKIGVVSNGRTRVQLAKLDACAIYPVLDAVCISEEIGAAKPSLTIFAAAANRARDVLTGGWMIGDNPEADIAGARAAGLRTAWLRMGRHWVGPGPEPDIQADSFAEAVAEILLRYPSARSAAGGSDDGAARSQD